MAITASGLYVVTHTDILDTTQLAINYDLDTHKFALFTNSLTAPNFSTDTAYNAAPYTSNEIPNGGGYTTGGTVITGTALSESPTGTIMYDATDVSWTSSTITAARGGLAYADALGDQCLFFVNFSADFSTVAGTFLVQWAAGGLWTWDLTP